MRSTAGLQLVCSRAPPRSPAPQPPHSTACRQQPRTARSLDRMQCLTLASSLCRPVAVGRPRCLGGLQPAARPVAPAGAPLGGLNTCSRLIECRNAACRAPCARGWPDGAQRRPTNEAPGPGAAPVGSAACRRRRHVPPPDVPLLPSCAPLLQLAASRWRPAASRRTLTREQLLPAAGACSMSQPSALESGGTPRERPCAGSGGVPEPRADPSQLAAASCRLQVPGDCGQQV